MKNEVIYRANQAFVLREIAGESILVSVGDGVADFCGIIRLNSTAKLIWQCLQKGATREELVRSVSEQFDAPEDQIASDLDKTLSLLESRGMINIG